VGMSWQFVVALFVLRRELGSLRWDVLRKRLWLNLPRDPKTGRGKARLFRWVVPCLMYNFAIIFVIARYVDAPVAALFPALQMPARTDMSRLADPQFVGRWGPDSAYWRARLWLSSLQCSAPWLRFAMCGR
jgi:hypothetical protein